MNALPLSHGLAVAAVLFGIGVAGLLARRNLIFMLMSVEILLAAAGMAFVVAGSRWGEPDGQIMLVFILAMAAAELSVGLALVMQIYHALKTLDTDSIRQLRG